MRLCFKTRSWKTCDERLLTMKLVVMLVVARCRHPRQRRRDSRQSRFERTCSCAPYTIQSLFAAALICDRNGEEVTVRRCRPVTETYERWTGLTWKGYFRKWHEEATSRFLVNRQSRSSCGKLFRSSLVNQIQSS